MALEEEKVVKAKQVKDGEEKKSKWYYVLEYINS